MSVHAQRRYLDARYSLLATLKIEEGCADCGYNADPVALDFDHRPGVIKSFCISTGVCKSYALERVLEEVDKCDVVCSNCHRIRSLLRGHGRHRITVQTVGAA